MKSSKKRNEEIFYVLKNYYEIPFDLETPWHFAVFYMTKCNHLVSIIYGICDCLEITRISKINKLINVKLILK